MRAHPAALPFSRQQDSGGGWKRWAWPCSAQFRGLDDPDNVLLRPAWPGAGLRPALARRTRATQSLRLAPTPRSALHR